MDTRWSWERPLPFIGAISPGMRRRMCRTPLQPRVPSPDSPQHLGLLTALAPQPTGDRRPPIVPSTPNRGK